MTSFVPIRQRFRSPVILRGATAVAALVLAGSLLWGCGGGGDDDPPDPSPTPAASGPVSQLNQGPKALETVQFNPGLADWGSKVFKTRGCVTCHTIGEVKQGPDLSGVAGRRTEQWIRKQIMDPEWMVKNDPISHELFAKFALQMANQHVPEQEVNALVQYLVQVSQ